MLAAPYLAAHRIWLHSPKCGSRAAEPGYCRERPARCNSDSVNTYCHWLAAKHQRTVRGDTGYALQPDESLEAPQSYDAEAQPRSYAIASRPEGARGVAMPRSNSTHPHRNHGQLLDVPAVARRLDVSEKTVRRLIARRELQAHRIGRLLRISEEELGLFLDSSR